MSMTPKNDSQAMKQIAFTTARALNLAPADPLYNDIMERAADRAIEIQRDKHPNLNTRQLAQIVVMELGAK